MNTATEIRRPPPGRRVTDDRLLSAHLAELRLLLPAEANTGAAAWALRPDNEVDPIAIVVYLASSMPAKNAGNIPRSGSRASSTASDTWLSTSTCLEKYVAHLHEPGAYNLSSLREERRIARGRRIVRRHILGIWTSILVLASIAAVVVYGIMFTAHRRSLTQAPSTPQTEQPSEPTKVSLATTPSPDTKRDRPFTWF